MDSFDTIAKQSPLAVTDWGNYFKDQVPETGWWNDSPSPFVYGQGWSQKQSFDYDPGTPGEMYGPASGMSSAIIGSDYDTWIAREHPELFDFTSGWQQGGVAGAGNVAKDPGFGQFSKTPEAWDEIQAAATKYGVPANFLQAIIAKESSGDWASNSTPAFARGMRIHGYIGVFENAAAAWGFDFNKGIGNRAYQIEMLAGGLRRFYDQLHTQNPAYGWLNVAAYHYSGDPTGAYTPGDSYQHGTSQKYMADVENWWKSLDAKAGNTWSNFTSTGQGTGVGSVNTEEWAGVNRWDEMVSGAAQKYGVPANLIKAIMRLESGGNPNAVSPQGATGLMQVMPFHVGGNQSVLFDPAQNIDVGTRILMDNYRRHGSWEMAAKAYLGLGGSDALGTTNGTYWQKVNQYWQELNASGSGMFGAPGAPVATTQMDAIWGGVSYGVSQENGQVSDWTRSHPGMYGYGSGLGITGGGHPGMDVVFSRGTKLFSPGAGTVIRSGGSGSYGFYGNTGSPGVGELRIRLDNGHEVILGHMMGITVRAGDRVTAGQPVGVSGGDGSGDHLHLEYRIPSGSTSSGWASVNPREYLGGVFAGVHQGAQTGLGYTQPLTFQNLMRAAASGQAIPSGPVYSQGGGRSGWNSFLRNAMKGNYSTYRPGQYSYTYQTGGGLPASFG